MESGQVACSHPLAVQAGLDIMRQGGNAVDAILGMAIMLTVVEPTSNGIGSDAFALISDASGIRGWDGSGRSPEAWNRDYFLKRGKVPQRGWNAVTVPGTVHLWKTLSAEYGQLPFKDLFEPAITTATCGYSLTPITATAWQRSEESFSSYEEFKRVYLPLGRAPNEGQKIILPDHASTLEDIANTDGKSFYEGRLASLMVADAKAHEAVISERDFAQHETQEVSVVDIDFLGCRVTEMPPSTQGMATLMALGIMSCFDLEDLKKSPTELIHLEIEAMKLALQDAHFHTGDPACMKVSTEELLDKDYLKSRASLVDMKRSGQPSHGLPAKAGTVNLAAADSSGLLVSFLQSNYMGFGSGVVVPGTGIAMQNRGCSFNLIEGHVNEVGPNKRPFHTLIPGLISTGSECHTAFSVMGGPMQAQGHLQFVLGTELLGQSLQDITDAPRWQVFQDFVGVEENFDETVLQKLADKGQELRKMPATQFGGAQSVKITDEGYDAGSDKRKDGGVGAFNKSL